MSLRTSVIVPVALLLVAVSGCRGWTSGRATFYGNEPWYWDIHHGSCGFGYLWPDQNTGWDVAAMSDHNSEYSGSCGACYEVECSSGSMRDGYGASLERSGVCRGGSVVVRVTDTCPCNYANNYYSNKRWCCGDMPHFDLSVWAFQKLSDMKWGVIPIRYRRVDCGYQPSNKASGSSFPGVFPPISEAKSRNGFSWYTYFPNGGFTNRNDGAISQISTADFLKKIGGSK